MNYKKVCLLLCVLILQGYLSASAYHPLITDDSGTIGKQHVQLELAIEYAHDKAERITARETQLSTTVSYGLTDSVDVICAIPYLFIKETDEKSVDGLSDISIEMKINCGTINNILNFAIKPGITIPSGDEEEELGTGKITGSFSMIIDTEFKNTSFYFNVGYIRNENEIGERKNLWNVSMAGEYRMTDTLKVVLNAGIEENPEKDSSEEPCFLLGGIVYSASETLDLDIGLKAGLNSAETDYTLLIGTTFTF